VVIGAGYFEDQQRELKDWPAIPLAGGMPQPREDYSAHAWGIGTFNGHTDTGRTPVAEQTNKNTHTDVVMKTTSENKNNLWAVGG